MERGLIFDCDGVLADTELHGHLVAFNQMWRKLGVSWKWSPEQYGEKLKIGGGKERMASLFPEEGFRRVFAVPEKGGRPQSSYRKLAQGENGHLQRDHLVRSNPAAIGYQENRGGRSRRRLEAGSSIHFRKALCGSRY